MRAAVLLLAMAPLAAQSLTSIDIAGSWRLSGRDDSSFAQPGFDDRGWKPFPLPRKTVLPVGTYWLRRQIDIPSGIATDDLVLTLGSVSEVYEVFVNGKRIAARGEQKLSQSFVARPESFSVPAGVVRPGEKLTLALRVWRPLYTSTKSFRNIDGIPDEGPYRLTSAALRPIGSAAIAMQKRERIAVTTLLSGAAGLLIAILLFLAWLMERERTELLLAIGFLLTRAAADLALYLSLPLNWSDGGGVSLLGPGVAIGGAFLALLAGQIAGVRSRWWRILVWIPPFIHAAYNGRAWVDDRGFAGYPILSWSWRISLFLLLVATLAVLLYGWFKARWDVSTKILAMTLALVALSNPLPVRGARLLRLEWASHGFQWTAEDLTGFALMLVLSTLLLRRLGADRRRKIRLEEELAAARLIQETLLQSSMPDTRGFSLDAAYLPASEVGGDFYCARPASTDGSLTVVVGDVSGKGLRAALLVAHLSGVFTNERSCQPAEMLAHLNESLLGRTRGGFVTCCCVLMQADGSLRIASAGHPAPWIDGVEAAVEPGLPLGVSADACYVTRALAGGRQVTLVSDGVVEAANTRGELFGFDRTREISTKSAATIAEAARAWGQNDDITVVTVKRRT